eukprot:TRINITY_DN1033_c0_g1_i1.p1 TRINITY_DN1033_c0_g1~~TRINITY_DN1033_c0_g1_i1.p1  ORF type:complete len:441 (-),score=30.82 TRINITY_DN1033_c0_g1_i1:490-1812(-)
MALVMEEVLVRQQVIPVSDQLTVGVEVRPDNFISHKKQPHQLAYGSGQEILLQVFNWESHKHNWFEHLITQVDQIADLGVTLVWFPPCTDSVSPEGYLPRDLYCLDSKYGSLQQLKRAVRAFKSKGIKVLADVVLNHRCAHYQDNRGIWNQFGGKLEWDPRAIVGDDPNYAGKGHPSQGDIFPAAPNIDHQQQFVQEDICEWLNWLKRTVGFDGWRLDFARGFSGEHAKKYIQRSSPHFVVGEYWDSLHYQDDGTLQKNQDGHRQRIIDWINATGDTSTAFDVTTKGILHQVFQHQEYWRLVDKEGKPAGLVGWWPSRSVLFLENHDTGSTQAHWPFPEYALEQGYVYIFTHPGTPTIFYDHLQQPQVASTIAKLIKIRKRTQLHCASRVEVLRAEKDIYAAKIDNRIIMKIGPGHLETQNGWAVSCAGQNWCIWERSAN